MKAYCLFPNGHEGKEAGILTQRQQCDIEDKPLFV